MCHNRTKLPLARLEAAVIAKLSNDVLCRATVQATVDELLAALAPDTRARDLATHRRDLASLDTEIANLTTAIAKGGDLPSLLEALTDRQARREALAEALQQDDALDVTTINRADLDRRIREQLQTWREELSSGVPSARRLLRKILVGPMTLTPNGRAYDFKGEMLVGALLGSVGPDEHLMWRARQGSNLQPLAPED